MDLYQEGTALPDQYILNVILNSLHCKIQDDNILSQQCLVGI